MVAFSVDGPAPARRGRAARSARHRRAGGPPLRPASHAVPRHRRHRAGELLGLHTPRRRLHSWRTRWPRCGRALAAVMAAARLARATRFVVARGSVSSATFMLLPAAEGPAGLDVALLRHPVRRGRVVSIGRALRPARGARAVLAHPARGTPCSRCTPSSGCGWPTAATSTWCRSRSSARTRPSSRRSTPVVAAGARPLCVGGDHSVTLPVLRSLARRHGPLAVVHFDAHPDTWDEYFGSKLFHGTPFRRAIEEGADRPQAHDPGRHPRPALWPRGLRLPRRARPRGAAHRADQGAGAGPGRWSASRRLRGMPLYCSFDIDAVDPAYAPGTGTPEVGGLTLVRSAEPGALAGRAPRWSAPTSSRSRRPTTVPGRSPRCSPPTCSSRSSA